MIFYIDPLQMPPPTKGLEGAFVFSARLLFHQLVAQAQDLGGELLALCFYDSVIDGIGEACEQNVKNNFFTFFFFRCNLRAFMV